MSLYIDTSHRPHPRPVALRLHLATMEALGLRRLLTSDETKAHAAAARGFEVLRPRHTLALTWVDVASTPRSSRQPVVAIDITPGQGRGLTVGPALVTSVDHDLAGRRAHAT